MKTLAPIPILRSFDEVKAHEFYIEFLNFEIYFEHRFDLDAPLYMGVKKDKCELHLSEHHGDASPGTSLRIEVEDVEAYCKILNDKKYKNARPSVIKQEWGYYEMSINDPFGNKLIFCTPHDD